MKHFMWITPLIWSHALHYGSRWVRALDKLGIQQKHFSSSQKHVGTQKTFWMGGKQCRHWSAVAHYEVYSAYTFFSTKQDWYFSYFSMKKYVVGTHWKHLSQALLTSTRNMFSWRNKKNIYLLPNYLHLWKSWKNLIWKYHCQNTHG